MSNRSIRRLNESKLINLRFKVPFESFRNERARSRRANRIGGTNVESQNGQATPDDNCSTSDWNGQQTSSHITATTFINRISLRCLGSEAVAATASKYPSNTRQEAEKEVADTPKTYDAFLCAFTASVHFQRPTVTQELFAADARWSLAAQFVE